MNGRFWRAYNYIARRWYEREHGRIEPTAGYHPAMVMLVLVAAREPLWRTTRKTPLI